jgi:hypothetical protein
MSELSAWLLEQLAETEQSIRSRMVDGSLPRLDFPLLTREERSVLATVKAHRAIMGLAEEATGMDLSLDQEFRVGSRDEAAQPYLGDLILRALAGIYADAPGFREEWR